MPSLISKGFQSTHFFIPNTSRATAFETLVVYAALHLTLSVEDYLTYGFLRRADCLREHREAQTPHIWEPPLLSLWVPGSKSVPAGKVLMRFCIYKA